MIVCLGWSICGTLTISTLATIAIAKQRMDAAYKQHPLMLWRSNGNEKQIPQDFIFLHASQSVHFKIEMDECHSSNAEIGVTPAIGELTGLTYTPPKIIKKEQEITVTARGPWYGDTKVATIILLPEPPSIVRHQYPGEDDKKRKAVFDFIIISNNYSWVIRSDQLIEENLLGSTARSKPAQQKPVCKPILELAGAHMFDPYVDVISIGTASREGPRGEEEDRADRRSKKIAEWVNLALANTNQSKHVYRMNLGQYLPDPEDQTPKSTYETARERPVVIIGVLREGEIDLGEALRNVLAQHPENEFFRFLAQHYPGRQIVPDNQLPETQCTVQ